MVRVTLRSANNAPADDVQNTFAVNGYTLGTNDEDIADHFAAFYTDDGASGQNVGEYINSSMARTQGILVEIVDTPNVLPNPPTFAKLYDLPGALTSGALPQEVAICLSFVDAVYLTTTAPGRHRGRVYIGPLNSSALQTVTGGYARPTAAVVTAMMEAAATLRDSAPTGVEWAIWSRALDAFLPVDGGWVDNEFDTQRRRGHVSTVRNIW